MTNTSNQLAKKLPELKANFIWIGGSFTQKHLDMLMRITTNQLEFFSGAYNLLPCIWVDRAPESSVRRAAEEFGVAIHYIHELYASLSDFLQLEGNEVYKDKISVPKLRQFVALESGLIAPINMSRTSNVIKTSDSYLLESRGRPNPALAADIIKMLLGLLHPGLFTDLGLTVNPMEQNSKMWAAAANKVVRDNKLDYSPCCIDEITGRFRDTAYFAASEGCFKNNTLLAREAMYGGDLLYDLGIIYTTDKEDCRKLHINMLEFICNTEEEDVRQKIAWRADIICDAKPEIRAISWTGSAWNNTLAQWCREECLSAKKEFPPIISLGPLDICKSFAGLTFKERTKSLIVDYKAKLDDITMLRSFQNKKGDDLKVVDYSDSSAQDGSEQLKRRKKAQSDFISPRYINTENLVSSTEQNLLVKLKTEVLPLLKDIPQQFFNDECVNLQNMITQNDASLSLVDIMQYFKLVLPRYLDALVYECNSFLLCGKIVVKNEPEITQKFIEIILDDDIKEDGEKHVYLWDDAVKLLQHVLIYNKVISEKIETVTAINSDLSSIVDGIKTKTACQGKKINALIENYGYFKAIVNLYKLKINDIATIVQNTINMLMLLKAIASMQ